MKSKKEKEKERSTTWTFILYPESAPETWRLDLKRLRIPVAISPLHSPEPEEGVSEGKPHHHIFLRFDSLQSYQQVKDLTEEAFNATAPQKVRSPKAMIRYFIHKDDPEKEQFEFEDIITMNGFDLQVYTHLTDTENLAISGRIFDLIDTLDIDEFSDLARYLADNGLVDMSSSLFHHASFYQYYITSIRHKKIRGLR